MSHVKKLSIDITLGGIEERQNNRLSKKELLDKVQEIYDNSTLLTESHSDYQYMLQLYRKLKGKNLTCPCLKEIKDLARAYLTHRVGTASGDDFELMDGSDIVSDDGEFLG